MNDIRRVAVRGLIYKNNQLFGQKLFNSRGDWWCTPGGGLEYMESLHDALTREMIEETGVKPVIGRLVLVQQYAAENINRPNENENLEFFFLIENADDYVAIDLNSTSHGTLEVAEFGFVNPSEKNMLPAILQTPEFTNALINQQPVIFYTQLD